MKCGAVGDRDHADVALRQAHHLSSTQTHKGAAIGVWMQAGRMRGSWRRVCRDATRRQCLILLKNRSTKIPGSIEIRTKADRFAATAAWRNVCPCTLLGRKRSCPHHSLGRRVALLSGEIGVFRRAGCRAPCQPSGQAGPASHSYRPPHGSCRSTRLVTVPSIVFCSD